MRQPRPYQRGDVVEVACDTGWRFAGGHRLATVQLPQPQYGAGSWLVRYEDTGKQDTVNERRFTLDTPADEVVT